MTTLRNASTLASSVLKQIVGITSNLKRPPAWLQLAFCLGSCSQWLAIVVNSKQVVELVYQVSRFI